MADYSKEIEPKMRGLWPQFFESIGLDVGVMRGQNSRNGPCPLCGGDDRAHWRDVDGRLSLYCRHCADDSMHSPEKVFMEITGASFTQFIDECVNFLRYIPSNYKVPKQKENDDSLQKKKAAESCLWILNNSEKATSHDYLIRKKIIPYCSFSYKHMLVIPVINESGCIINAQFISPEGEKRFKFGGQTIGGRCWLSPMTSENCDIIVCEGYATGCTLAEATGLPVCIAFTCGNLKTVVESVRSQFENNRIIIATDSDQILNKRDGKFENVGNKKGHDCLLVGNCVIFSPPLIHGKCNDWNDCGVELTKELFYMAIEVWANK